MSAKASFWAWETPIKPATSKLVLLCLADCHNADTGRCDPSVAYICRVTGLNRKTVPAAIRKLEELDLLTCHKRAGTSPQYVLHIGRNWDSPKSGRPEKGPARKGASPKAGAPENGQAQKRTRGRPEIGQGGSPKSGHKPTSNLKDEPTSSDSYESGGKPPELVDNSLGGLSRLYSTENPTKDIFDTGAQFLIQYGHSERSARSFLGKQLSQHGEGATLDALIMTMVYEPVDPPAWMSEFLSREERRSEITMDWAPPEDWVQNAIQPEDQGGLGIPLDLIRKARDVFVLWFKEQGIPHHDWLGLFSRWCRQDWQRAMANRSAYLNRLATSGGLGEFVHFQT